MKHILVNGLRLEYRDFPAAGEGLPTLLLLHEGLGCVAMWRDFPAQLATATGCRVVVWSRPGYGGSQPYPEERQKGYMHREAEESLPALIAALHIERPLLVGHSDGGSIALIFAGAFPEVPLGIAVLAPHEFVEEVTLVGIRAARSIWESTDWPTKLPGTELLKLPNCGHTPQRDQEAAVLAALLAFVDRVNRAKGS